MVKKSNNIERFEYCYGCGVCALFCPFDIIEIVQNKNGFYQPKISSQDSCLNCGLCLSVCAFNGRKITPTNDHAIVGYSCWSKNKNHRKECSSGGVGFEIGSSLIKKGYKAISVRYNSETEIAEHYLASSIEEFKESMGSKYIPSYTSSGLSTINKEDKYFVTGTPCQIDSLRKYINKENITDNFVLMDFFCHGVPSLKLWEKYLFHLKKSRIQIKKIIWRNKQNGWHDSFKMTAYNKKDQQVFISHDKRKDLFYRFFFGHYCLGKQCYHDCKYKMTASAADIRIGDLWGKTFKNNIEGVSGVLALTEKGKQVIESTQNLEIRSLSPNIVMEGQMRKSAKKAICYPVAIRLLKSKTSLSFSAKLCRIIELFGKAKKRFSWKKKNG